MATPSPVDPAAQPPPTVEHRDAREAFIPPSALSGRYDAGASSISGAAPQGELTTLRLEGAVPASGSYRPKTVPGPHVGDAIVLVGLLLGVIGFLVWRHFQRESQENFAGQDHNKD